LTVDQTTANPERELRKIARRIGCEITKVYAAVDSIHDYVVQGIS
jgi:hypothetical protein